MSDQEILDRAERAARSVVMPDGRFEDLLRRRDRKRRNQRIGAGALAIILALVSFAALTRAFNTERPADESPSPMPEGTVITFTGDVYAGDFFGGRLFSSGIGDLVAWDPDTGEVRTIVAADALSGRLDGTLTNLLIGSAAGSADGRWIAYEVVACGGGFSDEAGEGGLWVTNAVDDPRQLTKPCFEDPDVASHSELWAWSPAGAQLVVARISADGEALVLIDPATGERMDLGDTVGHVESLAWSPDGTRITYATMRGGGSIYSVDVDGGDHSLLASSVGNGSIVWSPDGGHILFHSGGHSWERYLMNADGSDLRPLGVDGKIYGMSWSPDGTRFAYATFSGGGQERQMQIWTQPPDGSAPSLLFESASAPFRSAGSPVWSPDGKQIAFEQPSEHSRKFLRRTGETVWQVVNADGTGDSREIDGLRYLSWRGGWYSCVCYTRPGVRVLDLLLARENSLLSG